MFKHAIRYHQAVDHLRGTLLPQNTPSRNQYVKGIKQGRKHTCLGKILIPQEQFKKKPRRTNVRKNVTNEDKLQEDVMVAITVNMKMDRSAFNSELGPPQLSQAQLKTSHQLLGYAIRRVANELHLFLRSRVPPTGAIKEQKWAILRSLTTWGRSYSIESRHAALTNAREKNSNCLVRFDDEVSVFVFLFFHLKWTSCLFATLFVCFFTITNTTFLLLLKVGFPRIDDIFGTLVWG